MSMIGAQIMGGQYENLVSQGVDPKRAFASSFANAVMQVPLEQVGLEGALKFWKPQKVLIGKLKALGEAMGREAITEFIQEYPDAATTIFAENPDKSAVEKVETFFDQFAETTKRAAYSGAIGGTLGGIAAGGGLVIHRGAEAIAPEAEAPAQPVPEARTVEDLEREVEEGHPFVGKELDEILEGRAEGEAIDVEPSETTEKQQSEPDVEPSVYPETLEGLENAAEIEMEAVRASKPEAVGKPLFAVGDRVETPDGPGVIVAPTEEIGPQSRHILVEDKESPELYGVDELRLAKGKRPAPQIPEAKTEDLDILQLKSVRERNAKIQERYPDFNRRQVKGYRDALQTLQDYEEARGRVVKSLRSERGSFSTQMKEGPRVYADLLTVSKHLIRQGHTKYQTFNQQLKQALDDVWTKVRHLALRLFREGKQILRSETGAISIERGQKKKASIKGQISKMIPPGGLKLDELLKRKKAPVRPPPKGIDLKSSSEEVERRWNEAKGIPRPNVSMQLRQSVTKAYHSISRLFPKLDPKTDGRLIDILRQYLTVPEYSQATALHALKKITGNLANWEYDVFTRNIILPDLLRDIDRGMFEEKEVLPFGYKNRAEVIADLGKFKGAAAQSEYIRTALETRQQLMRRLREELVENNLLHEEVLENDAYYHHQVLEYMAMGRLTPGTSTADVRLSRKGWQIARVGSVKDFNTEYLQSEFVVIAQGLAQLETVHTLDKLQAEADIRGELESEAKAWNYREVIKQANPARKDGSTPVPGDEDYVDPFRGYKQRIAMSNNKLAKMAYDGELDGPGYDDVIEDLADSWEQYLADKEDYPEDPEMWTRPGSNHENWFKFLGWLVKDGGPGSMQAATIFKAIAGRNAMVKEELGNKFKTWEHMKPEDYRPWSPDRHPRFYFVNSITDKVLERVQAGEKSLEDPDVRRVLARRPKTQWVIPTRLADTLDNFRDFPDQGPFAKASRAIGTSWKQWILLNPFRVVKYNINNLSGDLDITLAYDPKILKYVKDAANDLWAWQLKGKEMTPELRTALRKGVVGSGFTVREIPDITEEGLFKLIAGEEPNWIRARWKNIKDFTMWRENVLRLAAYRHFKTELAKGKNLYGASKKSEIDAIKNRDDKAAKLARELIGDYGAVSEAGQWLRKHLIYFWSWMEINAPRYVRLIKNLPHEGEVKGRKARIAGVGAKKIAWKGTKLAVKASMLYAAAMLYNATFWPDEERKLRQAGRRQLHLILGRREDGSLITLRFQGALSDALEWFGAGELPHDIMDVITKERTPAQKLKEMGWMPTDMGEFFDLPPLRRVLLGARPLERSLLEILTGVSLWPDISRPRPIRDRAEHIARTLSLDMPYRHLASKPTRGLIHDLTNLITYSTDPGEASYYAIRHLAGEYLREQGQDISIGTPTARSNALYYYKQALKYGDQKLAEKYKKQYFDLGGNYKALRQAIKISHPLAFMPKKLRYRFIRGLTPAQRQLYDSAVRWYRQTYLSYPTKARRRAQ